MSISKNKCAICKSTLHSINTNPFGTSFICRDCYNKIRPVMEGLEDYMIRQCKKTFELWSESPVDRTSDQLREKIAEDLVDDYVMFLPDNFSLPWSRPR